jgi:hypothetical protein
MIVPGTTIHQAVYPEAGDGAQATPHSPLANSLSTAGNVDVDLPRSAKQVSVHGLNALAKFFGLRKPERVPLAGATWLEHEYLIPMLNALGKTFILPADEIGKRHMLTTQCHQAALDLLKNRSSQTTDEAKAEWQLRLHGCLTGLTIFAPGPLLDHCKRMERLLPPNGLHKPAWDQERLDAIQKLLDEMGEILANAADAATVD